MGLEWEQTGQGVQDELNSSHQKVQTEEEDSKREKDEEEEKWWWTGEEEEEEEGPFELTGDL
jgi:hypothetical protein